MVERRGGAVVTGPAGLDVPAPSCAPVGCPGILGMVVVALGGNPSSVFTDLSISPPSTVASRCDIVLAVPVLLARSLFFVPILFRGCEPLPLPPEPPLLRCPLVIGLAATGIVDAGVLGV